MKVQITKMKMTAKGAKAGTKTTVEAETINDAARLFADTVSADEVQYNTNDVIVYKENSVWILTPAYN